MEMECVEVECVETSGCVEMNPYQFPSASQILPPPLPPFLPLHMHMQLLSLTCVALLEETRGRHHD